MFGFRRGFPGFLPVLLAVGFGFLLAGGAGGAGGALLFLPFVIMKMFFLFMMFSFFFRFAGGGGPWKGHHTGRNAESKRTDSAESDDSVSKDWEDAVRAAKREIDKLFPNPKE